MTSLDGRTNTSPVVAVDDDGIADVDALDQAAHVADRGDAERAGDDGDVALSAGLLDDEAAQPRAVVVEQVGRTHGARDQDRRRAGSCVADAAAGVRRRQDAQQAVRQVVEVAQALAPVGIALAQHPRPRLVLHALDGGFGGEARLDRLRQAALPAAVVGEHPIGFEDVAVLAVAREIAMADHLVDDGLELDHGGLEPHRFGGRIVGDQLGDDDARLVQHRVAERDAFGHAPGP